MKWLNKNDDEGNFEDRRGRGGAGRSIAGFGGVGAIIVIVFSLLLGKDPSQLLQMVGGTNSQQTPETAIDSSRINENENLKVFTLRVFNSANDVWGNIFETQLKEEYRKPTLVVFTDQTSSPCGGADASTGPFYCPGDEKIYLDLNFLNELTTRFKAPGDLAMAYVTAHEVGHHIQKLLGTMDKVNSLRSRLSQAEYNKYSVKLELQADFYAGLWARNAEKKGIIQLETGDMESAIRAAQAIGDDALQKAAQGYTVPDSFTHGTSKQRIYWFQKGYESGNISDGDTFNDPSLN